MLFRQKKDTPLATLTAAGQRIDLSDREAVLRFSKRRGQGWQAQAWNYRELIPELGAGMDYQAQIMSKVGLVIAAVTDDDEPTPLPRNRDGKEPDHGVPEHVLDAARECLDLLPIRDGYSFQGVACVNLQVTGEFYLHGAKVKSRERWRVLSTDEVTPQGSGFAIRTEPGVSPTLIKNDEALLRLWKPHPRWLDWPDSPMRRQLDVCEDVVLAGREIRAVSRSRVASNGILLVPNSMSVVNRPAGSSGNFQSELEVLMLAPIANEGSAGAVVPIVLRGEADDLEKVRHIVLAREDSPVLIEKLNAALERLRDGMGMPSDAGRSVRDMNHWNAWAVTTDNFKNYLEPTERLFVDGLTEAYLHPRLVLPEARGGWGLTEDEANLVRVWYDAGNITENANRSEDADAAHDRGAIGDAPYRAAKGFSEADAPTEEDQQRWLARKTAASLTPEAVARLITAATGVQGLEVTSPQGSAVTRAEPIRVIGERADRTTGGPGQQPTRPVPNGGRPPVMVGAADPHGVLDSEGGRLVTNQRLVDLERSLLERLMVAVDAALLRALERAGSKARSAVQNKAAVADLAALVVGLDAEAVCPAMGERLAELGITEDVLLGKAFDKLKGTFTAWTTDAVRDAVAAVVRLVGLPLTQASQLTDRLIGRVEQAWRALEGRLRERATALLYGRRGEVRGETPASMARAGDIRAALEVIGGDGGLAIGQDLMAAIDQRADRLGFQWIYGTMPRSTFHPHKRLDEARFSGWNDPMLVAEPPYQWVGPYFFPGDHDGCLCEVSTAWWVPDVEPELARMIMEDNQGARDDRRLAELDDAAGRTGTWAQRSRDQREHVMALQQRWLTSAERVNR